jgi:DNA-binding XRE family transcriptional regulator
LNLVPPHLYRLGVSSNPDVKTGANLKAFRKAKGLTQQKLASLIGKSRTQISEWESGTQPDEQNRKLLAGALDVAPMQLGPAWDPESPRLKRHSQQNHIPPQQSHVAAPPPPSTGADMGPGDQGLVFLQSVWGILTPELRQDLVEHARDLAHKATEPTGTPRKKASR